MAAAHPAVTTRAAGGEVVTVAVVVLAIALAIAISGLIAMAVFARTSIAAELLAEHTKDTAESQRDEALAGEAQAKAELAAALAQLATAQQAANAATTKEADHVAKTIADSPSGLSALAALNSELQPVSGTIDRGGPAAAGADHGDAGPPAVPPATGAGPGPAGGHG